MTRINRLLLLCATIAAAKAIKIESSSYNVVHQLSPRSYGSHHGPHGHHQRSFFGPSSSARASPFLDYQTLYSAPSGPSAPSAPTAPAGPSSRCFQLTECTSNAGSKYRTLDGSCNNLEHPWWGVANGRYSRLLSAKYGDGLSSPTRSVTGEDLPNSRLLSLLLFGDADVPDKIFTLVNMQFGQIVTHDMSMQAGGTQSKKHTTRCCTDDGKLVTQGPHKTCYPIIVPENDPAFSQVGTECMNFVRTLTDRDENCQSYDQKLGSGDQAAEQLTRVTSYMDLSLVYGNSVADNQPIREFRNGRMLVDIKHGYEFLPEATNKTAACDNQNDVEVCYRAGDVRVNQNTGLTILQTMLVREHNRIANALSALNPHWADEQIFQEARAISIAQYQHINYYEWLPLFLGEQNMLANKLIYHTPASSVHDYDPSVDPSVLNEHATAAFRYFHSQIEGRLDLVNEINHVEGSLRLSDWFNRPAVIEPHYDELSRGLFTQPEEETDINFDAEIKHFLFRNGAPFGGDLRAIDIQRNRDHGLAGYNDMREFCGLRRATTFEDFKDLITDVGVTKMSQLYAHPDDVDLTVGGSLEAHVEGALAGPTFLCILTEQFYRTRVGDRYFFERGTPTLNSAQLREIKKASMSRLFCDNSNEIRNVQPKAFLRPGGNNKVVPCEVLPQVDLRAWQEIPSGIPSGHSGPAPLVDPFVAEHAGYYQHSIDF